jgi:two-component system chemotaxis sensor kinase CheA
VTDPELLRLLILELERHLATLEAQPPDAQAQIRAIHALKGSAGLAGERDLAATLERLHRRMRDGDVDAFDEAPRVVRSAMTRLAAGETALPARWPEPPDDLTVRPLDPLVRAQYAVEVTDRLARIDEALAMDDVAQAILIVYRHVHTLKGAGSAVGDDAMSWFCHGLEEQLKAATASSDAARAMMKDLVRWRSVLGALMEDPEGALRSLRSSVARQRIASQAPRSSVRPPDDDVGRVSAFPDEATIRVASLSVDRLLDRFEAIDLVRERVGARGERVRKIAHDIRRLRADLAEALRLIGPPRPWGAPAAALRRIEAVASSLATLGEDFDGAGELLTGSANTLRESVTDAKKQLSAMRLTPVGRIFARLTTAIESEARRLERAVIVRTRGAEETIDRRLGELLAEPCLQIVRNSVAHGIETPQERQAAGKPESGTIELSARRHGSRLRLTIEDDGAGVDVADVRARAVEAGMVSREFAEAADDDTLLTLIFAPGFSLRDSSDLLAGRGIGLDIAKSAIQRLGGNIHVSSRFGSGFTARIDVPVESGFRAVMWVTAAGQEFALPIANAGKVRPMDRDVTRIPHLAYCLGEILVDERAPYALDLALDDEDTVSVGVDTVGETEDILVRPLTPLVAGLGPFNGAIVRGDGSLRLALDAYALAPRARALGRVPETRPSDIPSSRPSSRH